MPWASITAMRSFCTSTRRPLNSGQHRCGFSKYWSPEGESATRNHCPIATFLDILPARSTMPRIKGLERKKFWENAMIGPAHIRTTLAIAALTVAGNSVTASAQTIKIGLINSYSGFLAQAGDQMQKGIDLYVKAHEKDLPPGVKIEIIKRDDAAAPETGKRVAQELITRDHVQLLVGVVGSPIAAAISPLTQEAKVPLVITNAAGSAIPRISPYVVRVSFTLWQQAYPLGQWA